MYPNECSLALVHMPELDLWTESAYAAGDGPVQRLGINFGAPGDRLAATGTLWLDYPSVGGRSPDVPVTVSPPDTVYQRRHSSFVRGGAPAWVAASWGLGIHTVEVMLGPGSAEAGERPYRVRLYLIEPEHTAPGARILSLGLQGRVVEPALDIVKEAGGPHRLLTREFRGVAVRDRVTVELGAAAGSKDSRPILCGVEIIAEETLRPHALDFGSPGLGPMIGPDGRAQTKPTPSPKEPHP